MSLGKVTVWYMTEEERQAYIKKHPIVPTEKPKGTSLTDVTEMQVSKAKKRKKNGKRITDGIDTVKLNKMFRSGVRLRDIAKVFNISVYTVHNFIKEQRENDPDKWPIRKK